MQSIHSKQNSANCVAVTKTKQVNNTKRNLSMSTFKDFNNKVDIARTISNSQAVRNCIAEAKEKHEVPEPVIKFAVNLREMEPGLERCYVKEYWEKENWNHPTELTQNCKVGVAKAKRNILSPKTVVAWAVETFGLAKVYVKKIWAKLKCK